MATIILSIMKLHLPVHLFHAVMLLMAVSAGTLCASETSSDSSRDFVITEPYSHSSLIISGYNKVSVENINVFNLPPDSGNAVLDCNPTHITGNKTVVISGNSANYCIASGWADYNSSPAISLSSNDVVKVSGNYSLSQIWGGGALTTYRPEGVYGGPSYIEIANNKEKVEFIGNVCEAVVTDYASSAASGGAISANGGLNIDCNKGTVEFRENRVICNSSDGLKQDISEWFMGGGGAIFSLGSLNIRNNEKVVFEKNVEIVEGVYRLRGVISNSAAYLSSASGNIIEFRDSANFHYNHEVSHELSLNADYVDAENTVHKQQGDILFTGEYTEKHLNEILEADGVDRKATAEEILASRTTQASHTSIYGGRLRVEEGAVYQGQGITVMEGSAATVRVKDATLSHAGYDLVFNAGTTLELEGNNVISGNVQMESGSTLSFVYDESLTGQAALTLSGSLTQVGELTVNLKGFEGRYGGYCLITLDGAAVNGWDYGSLYLNNRAREIIMPDCYLRWIGNSLYYIDYGEDNSLRWTNETGSGIWNNRDYNWSNGEAQQNTCLTYVHFGANTGEQVTLDGNLVVNSMTVEQGGCYTFSESKEGATLHLAGDLNIQEGASADIQLRDGVYVDGVLRSSGELKVNKISGKGAFYISGGSLELSDDVDALAQEGSYSYPAHIADTELRGEWTGVGLSIRNSRVADGASVTLKDVILESALESAGNLVLGGVVTVQVSGLDATGIGIRYSAGENGYAYLENTYTLVTGDGSTSALAGTEWQVLGDEGLPEKATYSYTNGVLYAAGAQDKTQYWVNGAVNYDGRSEFATANTLVLNGGNLTLSQNLGSNLTGGIRVETSGTLTLGDGVQVDRTVVNGLHNNRKVTLQGSGRLNLNGSASFAGYELGDEWTGTVAISDDTSSNSTNMALHSIGQAGSTIELKNVKGHTGVNGGTVEADLVLVSSYVAGTEQAAFRVSDGYSNASDEDYVMTTFSGKVSGAGKIVFDKTLSSTYTGFAFTGNVADWSGAFEMNAGKTFNLVFGGNATVIQAAIRDVSVSSTLNLWLGADAAMQVKGTVDTDSITVTNDKAVSFGGVVSTGSLLASESQVGFASSATISGNMEVAELVLAAGATVDVGGCLTTGSIVLEGLKQDAAALTVGSFDSGNVLFALNGDALSGLNLGHGESVTIATSDAALADGFKALMANGTEKMTVTVYDYIISQNTNNVVVTADYANWGTRVWYEGAWVGDESWSDMLIGGYSVTDGVERVDLQSEVLEAGNLFIAPGSSCSSVVITNGEIYADYAELADASLTIGTGAALSVYEFLAEEKEVLLQGTLDVSNASIGSLSATTGSLSIQTDGVVTVGSNVTLGSFSSDGVLDIGSHTLNVAGGVSRAGSVIAGEVKVHNSGRNAVQFDTLITDKVTVTNRLSSSSYSDDISVGGGSAIGELVAETLELRDGSMQLGRDDKATSQSLQKLKLAAGTGMELNENTALTVTGTLDAGANTTVSMKQGSSLSYGDVRISNKRSDATASVTARELADGTGAVVTNAHASFAATAEKSVDYQFANSSVENAGSALLTLTNSGSTLTGLHATGGNVDVLALGAVSLVELEISTAKTISAASVTVTELAKLADGAKLAGNLTLASGAMVELGGTLTLEGALNLQTGLTLSGTVLETIAGLEEGQSHILFSGVTELNVQESMTLSNMRSIAAQTQEAASYRGLMDGQQVAAGDYFCNLAGNSGLVLSYNSEAGTVSISHTQAIPEPSTATLSLLALAGLCARRRRK